MLKKFLVLFLSATLFLLCSCDSTDKTAGDTVSKISQDISSDYYVDDKTSSSYQSDVSSGESSTAQGKTAIIKTEKQVYTTDVKTIVFQIYNNDTEECSFATDGYKLEIKKGNKWAEVPYKKNIVIVIEYLAIILRPSESWKTKLDLEKLYDLPLEKGIYRIGNESGIGGIDSLEFEVK